MGLEGVQGEPGFPRLEAAFGGSEGKATLVITSIRAWLFTGLASILAFCPGALYSRIRNKVAPI